MILTTGAIDYSHHRTRIARVPRGICLVLRDYLDLSNKDFAELMGVSAEQASRWTGSDAIGVPAERFLRVLAIVGPEALAKRNAAAHEQKSVAIDMADLIGTIGHMPPASMPASEVPINVRRVSSGWRPDTIAPAN